MHSFKINHLLPHGVHVVLKFTNMMPIEPNNCYWLYCLLRREIDLKLVQQKGILPEIVKAERKINVVYVGAVNKFFLPLIKAFFIAFKNTVEEKEAYHFYFIGTNYAPSANNKPVEKIGKELGIQHLITEVPQRISYFSALATLMYADILFMPGSLDADYNASKVYNNIFSGKPIFSIFNEKSLVTTAINETASGVAVGILDTDNQTMLVQKIEKRMGEFLKLHLRKIELNQQELKKYLADAMTQQQTRFFDKVLVGNCILPLVLGLNDLISS